MTVPWVSVGKPLGILGSPGQQMVRANLATLNLDLVLAFVVHTHIYIYIFIYIHTHVFKGGARAGAKH